MVLIINSILTLRYSSKFSDLSKNLQEESGPQESIASEYLGHESKLLNFHLKISKQQKKSDSETKEFQKKLDLAFTEYKNDLVTTAQKNLEKCINKVNSLCAESHDEGLHAIDIKSPFSKPLDTENKKDTENIQKFINTLPEVAKQSRMKLQESLDDLFNLIQLPKSISSDFSKSLDDKGMRSFLSSSYNEVKLTSFRPTRFSTCFLVFACYSEKSLGSLRRLSHNLIPRLYKVQVLSMANQVHILKSADLISMIGVVFALNVTIVAIIEHARNSASVKKNNLDTITVKVLQHHIKNANSSEGIVDLYDSIIPKIGAIPKQYSNNTTLNTIYRSLDVKGKMTVSLSLLEKKNTAQRTCIDANSKLASTSFGTLVIFFLYKFYFDYIYITMIIVIIGLYLLNNAIVTKYALEGFSFAGYDQLVLFAQYVVEKSESIGRLVEESEVIDKLFSATGNKSTVESQLSMRLIQKNDIIFIKARQYMALIKNNENNSKIKLLLIQGLFNDLAGLTAVLAFDSIYIISMGENSQFYNPVAIYCAYACIAYFFILVSFLFFTKYTQYNIASSRAVINSLADIVKECDTAKKEDDKNADRINDYYKAIEGILSNETEDSEDSTKKSIQEKFFSAEKFKQIIATFHYGNLENYTDCYAQQSSPTNKLRMISKASKVQEKLVECHKNIMTTITITSYSVVPFILYTLPDSIAIKKSIMIVAVSSIMYIGIMLKIASNILASAEEFAEAKEQFEITMKEKGDASPDASPSSDLSEPYADIGDSADADRFIPNEMT